jgi:hypothetical protein
VQTEIQKNPTVLAWRGERELRMLWGILQCASFPFLMIFPLSTLHDPDSRNSSVQIAVAVETVSTSLGHFRNWLPKKVALNPIAFIPLCPPGTWCGRRLSHRKCPAVQENKVLVLLTEDQKCLHMFPHKINNC